MCYVGLGLGGCSYHDIDDVPEAVVSQLREWFRNYKTAEGKAENTFALQERAMPREYAEAVARETHESWKLLSSGKVGYSESFTTLSLLFSES